MWLYLPTSCLSAPAMAASILGCESLTQQLEPSASWKGKLLSRRSWRRALQTAPWTRRLFGRTCAPLMAARGAEQWISSLRATRVNHSALLVSGAAKPTLVISGRTSRESSARSRPSGASSKTSAATCDWDFAKSPASYERWVIALRRDSLQRRKSARLTGASACSRWPTVTAEGTRMSTRRPGTGGRILAEEARNWKTPHGLTNNGDGGGGEFHKQVTHWQTPATDSFRSRGGDRKNEMGLDQQARSFPQDLPTSTPGGPFSQSTRKLNPLFVESLMGLPLGWTDSKPLASTVFGRWETVSFRWLQHLLTRDSKEPLSNAA